MTRNATPTPESSPSANPSADPRAGRIIAGLSEVADAYDVLFVDVWGVVHDGRRPFMDAVKAARAFRDRRGPVVLVSNSPRPGVRIPEQFDQIGVPTDFFDAIATSGDATRAELAARAPGPAYKLGPARDNHIYDGLSLEFANPKEAAFISCTGLFDDRADAPEDYRAELEAMAARGLDMVCANPDIHYRLGDQLVYAAGAVARFYQELGGSVILCGKPHAPIYDQALNAAGQVLGHAPAPRRILAIGDGPATDLAGAQAQGIDALFIAGGLHEDEVTRAGRLDADAVGEVLAAHGVAARYAAPTLVW